MTQREAVLALIEALPKCRPNASDKCDEIATLERYDATDDPWWCCPVHAKSGGMDGSTQPTELPWARPLRALQALLQDPGARETPPSEPEMEHYLRLAGWQQAELYDKNWRDPNSATGMTVRRLTQAIEIQRKRDREAVETLRARMHIVGDAP